MVKCLTDYAAKVVADPRYSAAKNSGSPRRVKSTLALFDCLSCDKCIAVCPNDANFAISTPKIDPIPLLDWVVTGDGSLRSEPSGEFSLRETVQIANFADACNECGNCDIFCPEWGGPYKLKPRFFSSPGSYATAHHQDGFVVTPGRIVGRIDGVEHSVHIEPERTRLWRRHHHHHDSVRRQHQRCSGHRRRASGSSAQAVELPRDADAV
jgi:Pyruvate/2-oxoacid:ferredoxin oxidoreductase delta subunit